MELRDIGRFVLVLLVFLGVDVCLALLGVRDLKPDDYDRSAIAAAFIVVLWTIRERRSPASTGEVNPIPDAGTVGDVGEVG